MTLPQKHAAAFFSSATSSYSRALVSFLLLTKSNFRKKGFIPAHNSRWQSIVLGSTEAEASRRSGDIHGQEQREMNECMHHTCLLELSLIPPQSCSSEPPYLENGTAHRSLGLPTSIKLIKTVSHMRAHRPMRDSHGGKRKLTSNSGPLTCMHEACHTHKHTTHTK